MCYHFSPLAQKWFLNPEDFKRDAQRLSELTNGRIEKLHLMGGEPLLHNDINLICSIARNNFKSGDIKIVTNALLLLKMESSFWETCSKERIGIIITRYPLRINYKMIEKQARNQGVKIEYWGDGRDYMQCKIPLDLTGSQNGKESFYRCHRSNVCIQLREGKLYTCVTIPYINIFNKYFKQDLQVSEKDYIDIYKVKDMNEIYQFLITPPPFCRYCDNKQKNEKAAKWGVTKRKITEWV
jgi:MoaA/NifB/PqqE/SkfB family radical SAM enzyme